MSFRDPIQWLIQAPACAFGLLGLTGERGPAAAPRPSAPAPQDDDSTGVDLAREIPALLTSATRLAQPSGCRLEFAVPPQLAVRADRPSFREAMSLLLAHAIRQAPGGRVLVSAWLDTAGVKISVCDDGSGAEAAEQEPWLLEPIRLLALQGGTVRIAPHPGLGTVITILLPAAGAGNEHARPGAPAFSLAHH